MSEHFTPQRFPALYRAAEKMRYSGPARARMAIEVTGTALPDRRNAPSSRQPVVEPSSQPDSQIQSAIYTGPERRAFSRQVVTAAPISWVAPAPPGSSPEIRTLQIARARAERELAYGRRRIVQAVDEARQIKQQNDSFEIDRIEVAMQQRIRSLRDAAGFMKRPLL